MDLGEEIRQRLTAAFAPASLAVLDESEDHRGHGGFREGGGTHWRVRIAAGTLGPMSRIERHRAIHAALGPDVIGRLHALAIEASG